MLWHKDSSLEGCDLVVLPGGFSYGDYLRSGAIARFSPIMQAVQEHVDNGGNLVAICNGFQIACEMGLLPGALLHNDNQRFVCRTVTLKAEAGNALELPTEQLFSIPIAHGEGRFFASDAELDKLEANHQILFRYVDAKGEATQTANPNGSMRNIAGVCNDKRNVFGLMPHPERAADALLGMQDGETLLRAMVAVSERNLHSA